MKANVKFMNSTWLEAVTVPEKFKYPMQVLLQRIHGYAMRNIRSSSQFENNPWAYNGAYFPDYVVVRRYHRGRRMAVHGDAQQPMTVTRTPESDWSAGMANEQERAVGALRSQ